MSYFVYILRGASGRHYIGVTNEIGRRLDQHRAGHTHTTRRLGGSIELVASSEFATRKEAAAVERQLKSWKNPAKAIAYLQGRAAPTSSGLVAGVLATESEFNPGPWHQPK